MLYMYIFPINCFQVCYDLCCPHGYHYVINEDYFNDESESPFLCDQGSEADFGKMDIWDDGQRLLSVFKLQLYIYISKNPELEEKT